MELRINPPKMRLWQTSGDVPAAQRRLALYVGCLGLLHLGFAWIHFPGSDLIFSSRLPLLILLESLNSGRSSPAVFSSLGFGLIILARLMMFRRWPLTAYVAGELLLSMPALLFFPSIHDHSPGLSIYLTVGLLPQPVVPVAWAALLLWSNWRSDTRRVRGVDIPRAKGLGYFLLAISVYELAFAVSPPALQTKLPAPTYQVIRHLGDTVLNPFNPVPEFDEDDTEEDTKRKEAAVQNVWRDHPIYSVLAASIPLLPFFIDFGCGIGMLRRFYPFGTVAMVHGADTLVVIFAGISGLMAAEEPAQLSGVKAVAGLLFSLVSCAVFSFVPCGWAAMLIIRRGRIARSSVIDTQLN